MIWLLDTELALVASLPEYESAIVTRRFNGHGDFSAKLPAADYASAASARYAQVEGEGGVYLVEHVKLTTGSEPSVVISGREATAMLSTRTIDGTIRWTNKKPGAIVKDLIATLTAGRALPLAFGTGDTLGTAVDFQRSWGDMGEVALLVASAGGVGLSTRLVGTTIYVDAYDTSLADTYLGDEYANGASSEFVGNIAEWRNYAYVAGEVDEDTGDRVVVEVDATGGAERRELYVDARDLQSADISEATYEAMLTQRGLEKLSDTRRVEYVTATSSAKLNAGDVTWYDAGAFADWFLVTEAVTTREGGLTKYGATLGEPGPTLRKTLRRMTT